MDDECEWRGTVGLLEDHLGTCEFAVIPCSKKCENSDGKINHLKRKDLEKHLIKDCLNRDCVCESCGKKDTYAIITGTHEETCEKKIVCCSNDKCSKTMQRQQLSQHIKFECEFTITECKHKDIGCKTELMRKEMAEHEQDDAYHLRMAKDTIVQMKEQMKKKSITFQL